MFGTINEQQATPYRPAVFTGADDDTVGAVLPNSLHHPFAYYANVALELPAGGGTTLTNIRVAYAQTAIHYPANTSSPLPDVLRHAQIVNCGTALQIDGSSSFNRQLTLGNCLFYRVSHLFGGSYWTGQAEH